jgi:hypothetical protein
VTSMQAACAGAVQCLMLPTPLLRLPSVLPQAGGEGGGKQEQEIELPFPSIPRPDYEAERPQEQTPPEPDNPLPAGLPPNHPDEVRGRKY